MGSAEETTTAASTPPPKQSPPSKSAAPPLSTTPPPPTAISQEPPAAPAYSADWATAVQAYYTAGAAAAAAGGPPPPFYSPPVWGSQMMSPYGTPIPYSPMYHPVYAHPSVATAPGYPAAESVINKSKGGSGGGGGPGKSGDGGKVTSGSADEYGSQSGGESGSEGSSDTRDNGTEGQDAARKRSFGEAFNEGESSQPIAAASNNGTTAESFYSGRQRTVSKLPVSAPGRATIPGPATNLNIGMDVWGASHVGSAPKVRPNSANVTAPTVGANGVMIEHQWIPDERELKRERRKQSNRESARRSRLRKQQECEDLARKVTELNSENSALKAELEQLNKVCKDLETENTLITEELSRMVKTGLASDFEGINCNLSNSAQAVVEGGGHVPPNQLGSNGQAFNPSGHLNQSPGDF